MLLPAFKTEAYAQLRKPRLRRNGSSVAHASTSSEPRQPTPSQSDAHDRESVSSHHQSASTPDELDRVSQVGLMWNTPTISSRSENQRSPSLTQPVGGDSNLLRFDSDSALAITRKVKCLHYDLLIIETDSA